MPQHQYLLQRPNRRGLGQPMGQPTQHGGGYDGGGVQSWGSWIYSTYESHLCMFFVISLGTYFLSPRLVDFLPGDDIAVKVAFLAGTYGVFSNSVCKVIGW